MKTLSIRLGDLTEKCLYELQDSLIYQGFSANMIISYLIRKELRDLYPDLFKEIDDEYTHIE